MNLPQAFLERMEKLLGSELPDFLESYNDERFYGLRVNTLKISVEDFLSISPFKLKPIPFTRDGFYYDPEDKPTKHPHYHAGLYYIQEPSAMAPVNVLEPKASDNVLDMCACPGGKSVQIASYLRNEGLLVSNDVSSSRMKALVKNLEIMGVTNVLMLNTNQEEIGRCFDGFFDKLLVDAPCSGEGMFRKEPKMVSEWTPEYTQGFRVIQEDILKNIADTLKTGGEMVYSTCTFSSLENEDCLEDFMSKESNFTQVKLSKADYEFATETGYGRLWPHKIKGEGHFVAKLVKGGEEKTSRAYPLLKSNKAPDYFRDFMAENLNREITGHFEEMNGKLYLRPQYDFNLKGVRVVRYGWLLGEWNGKKFTPSSALAMGIKKEDAKRTIDFTCNQMEVIKYLKGETLHLEAEDGLSLICVDGYPLGFGKMNKGTLKNMYNTAWRLL